MKNNKIISHERWVQAQNQERKEHLLDFDTAKNHYKTAYGHYFSYLNIEKDLKNKSILEIGPAKIAGLLFCENYKDSFIIEPTIYDDCLPFYDQEITFIHEAAETCDMPHVDEVWLLNILQHTINPSLIIERCKKYSNTIKFFEPINTGINTAHPHSFTLEYYKEKFGENVNHYVGGTIKRAFHGHECAYGVWTAGRDAPTAS
tara:strand:+ start:95 stop:703 length:609 start_codon:yes stop_codon:yes gene_type:complete